MILCVLMAYWWFDDTNIYGGQTYSQAEWVYFYSIFIYSYIIFENLRIIENDLNRSELSQGMSVTILSTDG